MRISDYIYLVCTLLFMGIVIYDIKKHRDKELMNSIIMQINKSMGAMIWVAIFTIFACGVMIYELWPITEKTIVRESYLLVLTLNSIYNITMKKVISKKGIGTVNKFLGSYREFIQWSEMKEWKWSKYDSNSLIVKYEKKGQTHELEWKITLVQKEKVEGLFNEFFKTDNLSLEQQKVV